MNSQFKNSSFGSVLYIGIIVIIALGLGIISWYMLSGYKIGTYSEDTILGSVYLGGLKEEDIDERVYDRIDRWSNDDTIVFELTYQGYSYQFDRDLFYFNLELSKDILKDGKTNELIAQYQESGTDRADVIQEISNLQFLAGVKDNVDIEGLVNDVLDDAGLMKTFSSKKVENYLVDDETSQREIESLFVEFPDTVNIDNLIQTIENVYGEASIHLRSKELFDIVTELGSLNDEALTALSSGLMELSYETNFTIHEVHYESLIKNPYNISTYPFFGKNSTVDQDTNKGFSIYNPNDSVYKVSVESVNDNTVELKLTGLAFVNDISVSVDSTEIGYLNLTTTDPLKVKEGSNGLIYVVHRTINDIEGNEIYSNDIIFEFYTPIHAISLAQNPE